MAASDAPSGPQSLRAELGELRRQLYKAQQRLAGYAPAEELSGRVLFLACTVDGERCGLPLSHVDEVVPMAHLAHVPEAPPWVPGRLNLRGETVPVLDVSARMRRGSRVRLVSDLVVVGTLQGSRIGLVVQAVHGVFEVDADDLRPPAAGLPQAPYLVGIVPADPEPVLLLSVPSLVASSDLPEEAE